MKKKRFYVLARNPAHPSRYIRGGEDFRYTSDLEEAAQFPTVSAALDGVALRQTNYRGALMGGDVLDIIRVEEVMTPKFTETVVV